jgi:hypothetical protein
MRMAKPKMEGTQRPIKMAASLSPLNHEISEKIKDRNAAPSISKSAGVNFLSIYRIL